MTDGDQTPNGEVEDQGGEGQGGEETVTINGVEMSAAEAQELLEAGKSMKQLKEQYPNVDFSEMPKAFTQARQKIAELERLEKKEESGKTLTDQEEKRKGEISEFFSDPFVQAELSKYLKKQETQLKEDLSFEKTMESLEAKYDGSDGKPKFDRLAVLAYGKENNIFNPETAYKELNEDALDEWKLQQKLKRKTPTTAFNRRPGPGAKAPEGKQAKTFEEATQNALAQE